jgi:hypothetical protein
LIPHHQNGITDSTRSNHFIYKENINAAYINLQKQFKKLSVQLGLRAEQTVADGDQTVKNDKFHRITHSYFQPLILVISSMTIIRLAYPTAEELKGPVTRT